MHKYLFEQLLGRHLVHGFVGEVHHGGPSGHEGGRDLEEPQPCRRVLEVPLRLLPHVLYDHFVDQIVYSLLAREKLQ